MGRLCWTLRTPGSPHARHTCSVKDARARPSAPAREGRAVLTGKGDAEFRVKLFQPHAGQGLLLPQGPGGLRHVLPCVAGRARST